MKHIIVIVSLLFFAGLSVAQDYQTCLEYLARNTTAKPGMDFALVYGGKDGTKIQWNVPGVEKPTFTQLEAILPTALAWKSNQVAEAAADIDKMEIKYVLRALVKTINKRIPADKQITEDELRVAIKAEAERAIKADVTP